jgi:hypothetical protein
MELVSFINHNDKDARSHDPQIWNILFLFSAAADGDGDGYSSCVSVKFLFANNVNLSHNRVALICT